MAIIRFVALAAILASSVMAAPQNSASLPIECMELVPITSSHNLTTRAGWNGLKGYNYSPNCGEDGDNTGYTWEGEATDGKCYQFWANGQQMDMWSLQASGDWDPGCGGTTCGGELIFHHTPDCNDVIPEPPQTAHFNNDCFVKSGGRESLNPTVAIN